MRFRAHYIHWQPHPKKPDYFKTVDANDHGEAARIADQWRRRGYNVMLTQIMFND